jgi:phosphatidylglycerophosphatase A
MRHFINFLATGCFIGKVPVAPGTAGTLVGVLLYLLIHPLPIFVYVVTVIAFIFLSAWVATKAQAIYGEQDPQEVVIDEIAGYLVTMAFHKFDVSLIIGGFVLFRIFDIVKPFPLRWIERRFLSGWGIVLDDVAAGIYANLALWFFGLLLPNW